MDLRAIIKVRFANSGFNLQGLIKVTLDKIKSIHCRNRDKKTFVEILVVWRPKINLT